MAIGTFNPADVVLSGARGASPVRRGPYMPTGNQQPQAAQPQQPITQTLGAQAVRATGSGPFDSAYRQNLATYAGGGYAKPGGTLSFNPTGSLFGNPTGVGSAPVLGAPTDLLSQALGGNPFTANTSAPSSGSLTARVGKTVDPQQQWIQQYLLGGRGYQPFLSK